MTAGSSPDDRSAHARHRPPRDCPVCSRRLEVTQLGCPSCGTGLTGRFRPCEFCGLDDTDRDLLRVFLRSRGNMKEVERHLGVSYPTARARFDDLLRRLDLGLVAGERVEATPPPASTGRTATPAATSDPRLETLRALASGDLDVASARERLTAGRSDEPGTPDPEA